MQTNSFYNAISRCVVPMAAALSLMCFASIVSAQQTTDTGTTTGTNTGGTTTSSGGSVSIPGSSSAPTGQLTNQAQSGLQQNVDNAMSSIQNQRQQGFAGAASGEQTAVFGRTGEGNAGGISFNFGNLFRQDSSLNNQSSNVRTGRRNLRAPLRLAFTVSKPSPEAVQNNFESRVFRSPVFAQADDVVAQLDDNKVLTIRGTVRSERQRLMMERLALLEPGVSKVNNQLAVVESDQ